MATSAKADFPACGDSTAANNRAAEQQRQRLRQLQISLPAGLRRCQQPTTRDNSDTVMAATTRFVVFLLLVSISIFSFTEQRIVGGNRHDFHNHVEENRQRHQDGDACGNNYD